MSTSTSASAEDTREERPAFASVPKKTYYWTFGALLVLLVLTVLVAQLPLGPFAPVVAMAIAGAKALLVVLVFMHVRYRSQITWAFAASGFVWLLLLFLLVFSDYRTRDWLPVTSWGEEVEQAAPLPAAP